MPLSVQVCIAIATLAFVAIAIALVRAMLRLEDAADRVSRLTDAAQVTIAQVDRVGREAQDLLTSMRDAVVPVQNAARRFGSIGERAADLSTAVLGELESPLFTAVAVSRGVKAGTSHLIQRLIARLLQPTTSTNGDTRHEYESTRRP